uniref:Conserved hypothetical plastid protein n=1 Tax=Rhodochaete parvula TaxID=110510 RepID=A0A1X9PUZ6_9RHOD|nr:conserved hypothetical plastid protein [Rhodochaete parvula]ASK39585.1 hypothetical protein Rhodc_039 [Rhodochaete parvula]
MNNQLNNIVLTQKQDQYFLRQIATIFIRLESNVQSSFENLTDVPLSIDCLTISSQQQIFGLVINHLQYKFLNSFSNCIDLEISTRFSVIVLKEIIMSSLSDYLEFNFSRKFPLVLQHDFMAHFSMCDLLLWKSILQYFISGNSDNLFMRQSLNFSCSLLEEHLIALLNNFIIKISNLIIRLILHVDYDVQVNRILSSVCSKKFLSSRYLTNLKNNLSLFYLLDFYVYSPKSIYENKYLLWNINMNGVSCTYIYCDRKKELQSLANSQIFIIMLLELQDLLFPKLQSFMYLLGKTILYILSYFFTIFLRIILNNILH